MPGSMFTDVVSPRADSNRKWYTVPLSLLVHALLFALIVVVPLVATDLLPPTPHTTLEYEMADVTPVEPPPSHRPPQPARTSVEAGNPPIVPLVAPEEIGLETGIVPNHTAPDVGSIDNVGDGLGAGPSVFEQAPVIKVEPPVEPVRPGGKIKPPTRTKYVMPVYPSMARLSKKEGIVIIEAIIDVNGKVENARVIRSEALLDQAALDAVRSWEYTPTELNGRPTPVIMTVTVRFALH